MLSYYNDIHVFIFDIFSYTDRKLSRKKQASTNDEQSAVYKSNILSLSLSLPLSLSLSLTISIHFVDHIL